MIIVLLAGVALVLIRRWRVFGPVQRRALAPVLWTGAATAAVGVAAIVADLAGAARGGHGSRPARADRGGAVRLPARAAALTPLARRRGQRARGAASAARACATRWPRRSAIPSSRSPTGCRIRAATSTPRAGRVELPGDGERAGGDRDRARACELAAIVHDRALREEPELVRTAGAAAALALENERLDAELRARYAELQASRARLVAAGDAARRRIERDLHDGAQQRFVALALTLRLARSRRARRLRGRRAARRRAERAERRPGRAARAGPRHPPRGADRARAGAGARLAGRARAGARDDHRRRPRRGCRRRSRPPPTSSSPRR